ncbi:hypothetical protein [Klebsiella michiganensis]
MLKITGLDKLQKELKVAQLALSELDGNLGTVHFDPQDPASIENAIQKINQIVDERVSQYSSNSIIGPLAEQMKQAYRENLIQKATKFRIKNNEENGCQRIYLQILIMPFWTYRLHRHKPLNVL